MYGRNYIIHTITILSFARLAFFSSYLITKFVTNLICHTNILYLLHLITTDWLCKVWIIVEVAIPTVYLCVQLNRYFNPVYHHWASLTLWSPSSNEAQSLLTCCAAHARAQLVPMYSLYAIRYTIWIRVWVAWQLSRNSALFGAAIWRRLLQYFEKKKRAQSVVYCHVVVCSFLL